MEETNSYAMYCRDELKQKSQYEWNGISLEEIAHYFGIHIFMGVCKLPVEQMYWTTNSEYVPVCCPRRMNYNKFKQISKYFHFCNRKSIPKGNKDKLIHIQTVMEFLQEKCRTVYTPQKELSLDEGMLPYKGRLTMKVYSPGKPDKYGLKFYILAEAESGYVLDFSLYRRVSNSLQEIVFTLSRKYFGHGYHLYMDNFYNSAQLTEELYENGMHSCGTHPSRSRSPKVDQVICCQEENSEGHYDVQT